MAPSGCGRSSNGRQDAPAPMPGPQPVSREDGFRVADVDAGLLDDPKMRHLWRRLQDPATMAQAALLYVAVILASWGAGDRRTADEAAPIWLDPSGDLLSALQEAGLLDGDGLIPA